MKALRCFSLALAGLFSLLSFSMINTAEAMFIATRSGSISQTQPLRLVVVGYPGDLGRLLTRSALVRIRNYEQYDPNSQVVFLGIDRDQSYVASKGFRIAHSDNRLLRSSDIERVIVNSRAIRSLDIYSHANVQSGAQLDSGRTVRPFLSRGDSMWSELARKRMEDTFVFLHGCNTGVNFAPWVARNVGVAAYGSLSGTNFQYVYDNEFWAFPYTNPRAERSSRSSLGSHRVNNCRSGECVRMKPDNAIYRGYWGEFSAGGYPAYKIFCPSSNRRLCQRAAVHNIKTFPSVVPTTSINSVEDFKEVAMDFMCPDAQHPERTARCRGALQRAYETRQTSTFSPFLGTLLNCTLQSCNVEFECRRTIFGRVTNECSLRNLTPGRTTAFVDDFLFLMDAFWATR